jgi:hypothetical protein
MTMRTLRRKFSFALPAFVFLSLALAERVEVRTVAKTLLSLGAAQGESVPLESARREDIKSCGVTFSFKGFGEA